MDMLISVDKVTNLARFYTSLWING